MTPAQAAWLRKLRDEGPQPPVVWANPAISISCMMQEWSVSHHETTHDLETITPAGLAALEAYEKGA